MKTKLTAEEIGKEIKKAYAISFSLANKYKKQVQLDKINYKDNTKIDRMLMEEAKSRALAYANLLEMFGYDKYVLWDAVMNIRPAKHKFSRQWSVAPMHNKEK